MERTGWNSPEAGRSSGRRGPLLGNFEENILNQRLQPIRTVDGYRIKLKASGVFETKQLESRLEVSFFSAGVDSFPYLCQAKLDRRGYRIPKRGTLQVALLNPLGTIVKLFLLHYDLSDMPANSHTFLRQKTVLMPSKRVQYLIQFNIVSSKSARIYLNKDLKIFISRKSNLETASQLMSTNDNNQQLVEKSYDEMPADPKYYAR